LKGVDHAEPLKRPEPDDPVVLMVSNHRPTDSQGLFYLIPSDSGRTDGQQIRPDLFKKWVSSDELSEWLPEVDAENLVMIVDTCHPGGRARESRRPTSGHRRGCRICTPRPVRSSR
jgi:hypothetical protein